MIRGRQGNSTPSVCDVQRSKYQSVYAYEMTAVSVYFGCRGRLQGQLLINHVRSPLTHHSLGTPSKLPPGSLVMVHDWGVGEDHVCTAAVGCGTHPKVRSSSSEMKCGLYRASPIGRTPLSLTGPSALISIMEAEGLSGSRLATSTKCGSRTHVSACVVNFHPKLLLHTFTNNEIPLLLGLPGNNHSTFKTSRTLFRF